MITRLTEQDRARLLPTLPDWRPEPKRDGIEREFVFADFAAAFGFMASVAILAEKADHHPEWSNVYNRVEVVLTTHDVNGLSMNDMELARYMDQVAAALAQQA